GNLHTFPRPTENATQDIKNSTLFPHWTRSASPSVLAAVVCEINQVPNSNVGVQMKNL
ncbi:hypothetical protein WH47_09357, partial [Habropoda laboriosa]